MDLRNFLYVDAKALDSYIAALEGGVHDSESIEARTSSDGKASLAASVPFVAAGAGVGSTAENRVTAERRVTEAAKMKRLVDRAKPEIFETMTEEVWMGIQRGELFEAAVDLRLSKLSVMTGALSEFARLVETIDGISEGTALDPEARAKLNAVRAIFAGTESKGIPVVMDFLPERAFKLIGYLQPEGLRVSLERLPGEITVMCKIQRRLRPGEKVSLGDPFESLKKMPLPPAEREKLLSSFSEGFPKELQDEVGHPTAVVNVLSIYT